MMAWTAPNVESVSRSLFLDPSSSCIGWARVDYARSGVEYDVVAAGRIVVPTKLNGIKLGQEPRIDYAAITTEELVDLVDPSVIVIEVPSGKVGSRHRGGGSGLSIYGRAVGRIEEMCLRRPNAKTHRLTPTSHTKKKRQAVALRAYPLLKFMHDPGKDISDAIALAVWFFDVHLKKESA